MKFPRLLTLCLVLLGSSLAFAAGEKPSDKAGDKISPHANAAADAPQAQPTKSGTDKPKGEAPATKPAQLSPAGSETAKINAAPTPTKEKDIEGLMILLSAIVVLAVLGLYALVWMRTQVPTHDVHHVHTSSSGAGADPKVVAAEVAKALAVNPAFSKIAAISNVEKAVASIQTTLSGMQQTLPQAAGKAAAEEVSKSQVGDLKEKLVALQSELDAATAQAAINQQAMDRANAAAIDADRAKHQAVTERDAARESLRHSDASVAQLRQELEANARQIQQASEDVQSAQKLCLAAQNEVKRTLEVNVPPGVSDPAVVAQMQALHREAIQGSAPAVIAWATLCSFSAADVDPSSKDFLLHALKRLGSVLVNYWKSQEGSTAKDRHEKLAHWAKCLSEHAQGRFSLIVPPLGSPVNKAAMSTAGSATTVQEVLTWQVRNPAGATFSLAEIA